MKYLADEDLKIFSECDSDLLKKAVKKAEDLLEIITLRFYDQAPFETDVGWRKEAVKRAILAQIEYFIETGETTAEGLNSTPQSVSIGRTRVTTVHGNSSKSTKNLACEEFYLHLSGTGLLYRGCG
ncbi:hypothetical protein [Streptococcus ruminantium]|uniref:hypothetical protein n=1 Tax=Streptococcus ruminantium TaxID=1917441 RepID=UPI0012DCFF21|nr:hypothetical protein [Streptococcus ruminantium]